MQPTRFRPSSPCLTLGTELPFWNGGSCHEAYGCSSASCVGVRTRLVALDQPLEVEMIPGGAAASVAPGVARLGMQAGWISKLPDNPLSRLIIGEIRGDVPAAASDE